MSKQCVGLTEERERCKRQAEVNSNYCYQHVANNSKTKTVITMEFKASVRRPAAKKVPAAPKVNQAKK